MHIKVKYEILDQQKYGFIDKLYQLRKVSSLKSCGDETETFPCCLVFAYLSWSSKNNILFHNHPLRKISVGNIKVQKTQVKKGIKHVAKLALERFKHANEWMKHVYSNLMQTEDFFLTQAGKVCILCLLKSSWNPSLHFVRATIQSPFNFVILRLNQILFEVLPPPPHPLFFKGCRFGL